MKPAPELLAFNLLDEPWLPVRFIDGTLRDASLLEAFARASEISSLAETSPPNLMAEYRLLLTITHRAMTRALGSWRHSDRARWFQDGFPPQAFTDYLEHWRERFWLFHPEQPFMQVAALASATETRDKYKPWTQIAIGRSCGDDPTLFDHSIDSEPAAIASGEALRHLLGYLQFVVGGRTLRVGAKSNDDNSDKAGPLRDTAAVLATGSFLRETLSCSLHLSSSLNSNDLPSWERSPVQLLDLAAMPRPASGPNDRYTRLTRAILLLNQNGKVRTIRFAAGLGLLEDDLAPDDMASYRSTSKSPVRISFTEGRAFWRDLPALLPDAGRGASLSASVLGYAANLYGFLGPEFSHQRILVAGVASNKAKLAAWRMTQIVLPTSFLQSASFVNQLSERIRAAESLHAKLRNLAGRMYADMMLTAEDKHAYSRATGMLDRGPAIATFFGHAEHGLPELLQLIAQGQDESARAHWQSCLLTAARNMWEVVVQGLGQGARAVCAEARFYPKLQRLLREYQPAANPPVLLKENS